MRLREDEVVRPDGGSGIYGVVEVANPAVFVVALTDDDEVVLVHLYRYTTGRWSIEVPAGSTDGEDALVAARRELAEETGLEAAEWIRVGGMSSLNGICDAPEHVFLARGLRPVGGGAAATRATQEEEGIADVRRVPFGEVLAMIGRGEIVDAETMAAMLHVAVHLGRVR
ncbi:NUDIX domain-containing protein [Agrococcus sp. SGAir0287]|uniref:NUDIX domain-containing protein n=1 Tax=Agrococcus sp. SGAir0287 TaxID=2070347 RepID=UPI0010CD63AE|nr:NUDIX hydrolase [Agrococcus sp. SGAir0287]QCR20893.1 NUDIX hydrolase [Agrococcus sp. SGAir0287]